MSSCLKITETSKIIFKKQLQNYQSEIKMPKIGPRLPSIHSDTQGKDTTAGIHGPLV